ncbi:GNAT family N-acetyltransferase [Streptomyces sp. WAC06614]|uniref:GNAT family N-acetyltransferase n=1 Tax=Streptomyces sp. WAC06614 TaxID=2487416 RepID=UPI000F774F96|nr:GNAT family N-acetyltransferase [Streptomyces sp. WAC06614]RSS78112.1 N-acetyltransferase [Streptomyces sp. WAC06614]
MEPTTLTTERLLLRPWAPGDADAVHRACQDPAIQRWTAVPVPYGPREARGWTAEIAPAGWARDTEYSFAVCRADSGTLVGAVGLHVLGVRGYEVGYWAAAEHRGHGYTVEAVRAVTRWAFTGLGAGRVEWRAEVGNAGSRAVAEKAGFRVEGVLRAGLPVRGTWRDCWVGGLLPGDVGLPSALPYLPAPDQDPAPGGDRSVGGEAHQDPGPRAV